MGAVPRSGCSRRLLLAGLGAGLSASYRAAAAQGAPLQVRHAIDLRPGAPAVFHYELAVLRLLLERTLASHGPYELKGLEPVPQARAFRMLAAGELDLAQALSSVEHEQLAEPLPYCLHRGLLGLRQPVALAGRARTLEALASLADLRRLRVAQVVGWPDIVVLQANGVPVQPLPRLELMPEALRRDRADLIALGVTEAAPIVEGWADLALLRQWLIAYPAVYYIFVSRHRPELHSRLKAAWPLVLADGSFIALFDRMLGPAVQEARLAERRWIMLANPGLLASLAPADSPLWHPLLRGRWSAP